MFKKSIIAAAAALVISASMAASPAHALSKKGAFAIGAFSALAITAVAAANAQAHGHDYGYEGHGGYSPRRSYKRAARRCADRYGWKTWRWERCMERRGF